MLSCDSSYYFFYLHFLLFNTYLFEIIMFYKKMHILKMLIKDIQIQIEVWLAFWDTLKENLLRKGEKL